MDGSNRRLFNRDFVLLFVGNSISQLGDGAGFIGLMWWVTAHIGSASLLGLVALTWSLAGVLVGPIAGALADRFSKKAIVFSMDLVRVVTCTGMAYLVHTRQMTPSRLLALVAVTAMASECFRPALNSSVPLIVGRADLPRANSFMGMASNLTSIFSYGIGGVLVALVGVPTLMVADAISFLICALAELFVTIPPVRSGSEGKPGHLLQDIREGIRYVRANRTLVEIVKVAAVMNFVIAPLTILLPKYVKHNLGGSSALYGYLLSSLMLGMFLASVLISATKLIEHHLGLVIYGLTTMSLAVLGIVLVPGSMRLTLMAIMLVIGFFEGILSIHFFSLIQKTTSPEQLGRISGLVGMVTVGLQPISQGVAGFLGDRVPIWALYVGCSVIGILDGAKLSSIPGLRELLSTGAKSRS